MNQAQENGFLKDFSGKVFRQEGIPKLLTAEEIQDIVRIPAQRLLSLADANYIPHIRIDGGDPLFYRTDLINYVKHHMLQMVPGKALPATLTILEDTPRVDDAAVPRALSPLTGEGLRRMPNLWMPPCVYFLVRDREVVYVGQTISLASRLESHRKDKQFDEVFYLPTPREELLQVESGFIKALDPELNKVKPRRRRPASMRVSKEEQSGE